MTCPTCGHENAPGTRFCGECGTALVAVCPNCGTENPPGNRFCGQCGTALATAPARTERRMVTVVFADLVGFTPFSESRDAEEVRDVLSVYFERSREIVERFGGEVEKFIGDAVMAWWGAVEAREDDAERAVRAALELVDMVSKLGSELEVDDLALRAGVLTGEAAVNQGGDHAVLVGDMVNTASRLQSIAEPGTVVVGEPTRNLVAEAVEFKPLGEKTVKGKEVPVRAFQAVYVVAQRGGRGRSEGLEPPFTGRHEEIRILKDQLHATGREGRARLVSIVGDPGIGKTRLAGELQKYIDGITEGVYWHQGRSPAYGDSIALWSVGEMIRSRAGVTVESEDRAKSRLKLRTMVAEFVPFEEEREWVEPRLAALIGLDEMPPGDRDELFAALRTFFHRVAERGPVVMVFEDFHWADDGVVEFITELVDRSTGHPIMVLTLSRPDLLDRHPGWGSGRRNTVSLHLAPLTDDEMTGLVAGMVPGITEEAIGEIVRRAAGIPLYAVEFVRMLLGSGDLMKSDGRYRLKGDISAMAVPDSLAAVIGARLDRLPPESRSLVQDAAVLGQSFTITGLAAMRDEEPSSVDAAMRPLITQELFQRDDDPRSADRGQVRFVQGLIREVAYGRLSRADRHLRHRAVAEYFGGLDDPELAGVVANHYLAAHETAPSGTEGLLEKGRAALLGAADRANDLRAHAQALSLYRQALDLAETPPERAAILVKATTAAGWGGDLEEAITLGHEAIAAWEGVDDDDGCYEACSTLGYVLNSYFRADEAVELLQPLYAEIPEFDTRPRVDLGLEMVRAYMLNQMAQEALDVADRVLPAAERLADPSALVDGITSKATALADVGRYLEAEVMLAGVVDLTEVHGLQHQAIRALNNLAVIQARTDHQAAFRTAEAVWEHAQKYGGIAWLERAKGDRAGQLVALGRFDEALEVHDTIDTERLPAFQQATHDVTRMMIDSIREHDPEFGTHLRGLLAEIGPVTDPQARASLLGLETLSYASEADWEHAFETSISIPVHWSIAEALNYAVRTQDPQKIRTTLEEIERTLPRGRLRTALTTTGAGALLVLEGDRDQGAEVCAQGADLLAKVLLPMALAGARASLAALIGLDHPVGAELGGLSQEWLRTVGAHGLEVSWKDGLPGDLATQQAG